MILPATPVDASTRSATSRSPGWISGGVTSMPSWRIELGSSLEPATKPISWLRSVSAALGAQRRGISLSVTSSSLIASLASTGFVSSSTVILGPTWVSTSET